MKEFLRGKPIAVLLGATALISAAVIAATMLVALLTSGKAPDKSAEVDFEQSASAQISSNAETEPLSEDVLTTQQTAEASTTQQPTTKASTAAAKRVNISGKFSSLGIRKTKLSRMIYTATNSTMWHGGKIKGNNEITYGIADYLRIFSTDFMLASYSIWNDAPKALDSRLKTQNLRCTGALDIGMFNKIMRDLYGPETPTFTYSDFPSVSSGKSGWHIMHADSSYGIGECLVMVDSLSGMEFESNSGTVGEYVGFCVKDGLISAIYVSLFDYENRPTVVLNSEFYFAKDSEDYYYLHSVNPDRFATGDSEVHGIDKFDDYEFYEIFGGSYEPHELSYYLPEYLKTEKATTAAPTALPTTAAPQKQTMEQVYSQVISTAESDTDLEYAHDLQYCLFDIDNNGIPELIISGAESMGWYFSCIYTYNGSTGKADKVDVLYHYNEIKYSPKFSALAVSETKTSVNFYECVFYKLSNGKLVLDRRVSADRFERDDYVYYLTDSSGNTVEIDSDEEYYSDLVTLEMVSI